MVHQDHSDKGLDPTYIGHNTYTGRRINLRSKATTINIPIHKSDLNDS